MRAAGKSCGAPDAAAPQCRVGRARVPSPLRSRIARAETPSAAGYGRSCVPRLHRGVRRGTARGIDARNDERSGGTVLCAGLRARAVAGASVRSAARRRRMGAGVKYTPLVRGASRWLVLRRRPVAHIAEQESGHLSHLDFLAALGDAIAAMVAVDMFERFVA